MSCPVLMDIRRIGRSGITCGNIQIAVRAKLQAAAVVTTRQPCNEGCLAGHVDCRRIGLRHSKPCHMCAIVQVGFCDVADIAIAVVCKVWMERQCIDLLGVRQLFGEIDNHIRFHNIRSVGKRNDFARLFDHKQTVTARCGGNVQALIELERRENTLGHVSQRWVGGFRLLSMSSTQFAFRSPLWAGLPSRSAMA